MFELYDYQRKAFNDIRFKYKAGFRAPILVLPTGGGKTVTFGFMVAQAVARGNRVLIMAHRVELIKQAAKTLRGFGIRAGYISPKFTPDFTAPVQCAMVQTLVNRLHLYEHFDLIITDECHHVASNTYLKILNNYPDAFQLGVTATPQRLDGKGLGKDYGGVYDCMVVGPSTGDLISMDKLSDYRIFEPPSGAVNMDNVGRQMGDFNKKQSAERVDDPTITGCAVDHYEMKMRGQPGVAFCINKQHARNVAADFSARGWKAFSVSGDTPDDEREDILNGLGSGIDVVTSCDVISEGTDIPAIVGAILLRPTQSLVLYLQQIGRALRLYEGKDRSIVLDHVGNWVIHGLPHWEREWTLKGTYRPRGYKIDKEDNGPIVTQCEECFSVFDAKQKACPECGHLRPIRAAKEVKVIDGELQEVDKENALLRKRNERREQGSAKTLEELKRLAIERGYKPGWAKHVYESRQKKLREKQAATQ